MQIVGIWRVHAIKAAVGGGRRGNPEMHFRRAGIAHHGDDLLGGGAAHDGIIHQHDLLALEHGAVGIVLQPHAQVADGIGRLDEGASDINGCG